jgi:penicillin-binding protein, 1A family
MKHSNDKKVNKKNKKEPKSLKSRFIKFIVIILILFLTVSIGYLAFKAYIFKTLAKEMFNNSTSTVFDSNKNVIAEIGSERNRDNIKLSEMPNNLKNAYIAIEDQRFYKHHGVDIKRTGAAILSYVIRRGSSSFGGSTITQQLVKNLTGDDSNTISRKVKEWFYACVLDCSFSKDDILEAYLNIIYTGPNIYGVKEAALYYFNRDVKDLNLAECAFLAGINNSPNSYNPFSDTDKSEKISKRTKTVLSKMKELGYISENEYNEAVSQVDDGLKFSKGNLQNNSSVYSYHTDGLINEIVSDFSNRKHISQDFATNYFYLSGSSIYSTQNSDIQKVVENECKNKKYVLKSSKTDDYAQAAIVIMDQSNGYVIACSGGLGEKTKSRGFNRATQMKRQTGSSMKPVAVLAPAIEKKLVTNVTVFADEPTTFTDYNGEAYSPIDYDNYKGSITLRQAVESSQNIPFVKLMEQLTPQVSIRYLKKMGITTLNDKDVNLALALGGLDQGISPLEFAGAYSSIANDGIYIEPTFYTKINSHSNETVLISKQKKRRVISKDAAFILKQLLTEPVTGSAGTATYCSISGMDVAAKTGTTNENYDRWLCGFTPYYTAVCWYGFDMNESINFNGKNPAGLIWSSVMKNIHSGLPSKKFEKTDGVVTSTICRDSGKVANSSCPNTFTEYFLKGTVPDMCTQHSGSSMNSNKTNKNNSNSKNTTTNISTPSSKEENNSSSSTQSTVKTEQNNTPTETNNKTTTNTNTTPSSSSTENKTPSNNSSSANTNTEKNNTVNNVNNSTSQNNSTSNENTTQ